MVIASDWSLLFESLQILLVAVGGFLWEVYTLSDPSLLIHQSGMVLEFLGVEDAWNTLVVLWHWESNIHREVLLQAPGDVTRYSCLSSQIGAIQLR